jgi:hypothetical protein
MPLERWDGLWIASLWIAGLWIAGLCKTLHLIDTCLSHTPPWPQPLLVSFDTSSSSASVVTQS